MPDSKAQLFILDAVILYISLPSTRGYDFLEVLVQLGLEVEGRIFWNIKNGVIERKMMRY
jgi:hypothetical protein